MKSDWKKLLGVQILIGNRAAQHHCKLWDTLLQPKNPPPPSSPMPTARRHYKLLFANILLKNYKTFYHQFFSRPCRPSLIVLHCNIAFLGTLLTCLIISKTLRYFYTQFWNKNLFRVSFRQNTIRKGSLVEEAPFFTKVPFQKGFLQKSNSQKTLNEPFWLTVWGLEPQAPFVICLSCIGLFGTEFKVDNFGVKKFTFGSSLLPLSKILVTLLVAFNSFFLSNFSSDYTGRIWNKLTNAFGLIRLFFSYYYKYKRFKPK